MKFLGFEIKFRHDRYAAARVELERKAREERAAWEAEENDREQAARERETEEQKVLRERQNHVRTGKPVRIEDGNLPASQFNVELFKEKSGDWPAMQAKYGITDFIPAYAYPRRSKKKSYHPTGFYDPVRTAYLTVEQVAKPGKYARLEVRMFFLGGGDWHEWLPEEHRRKVLERLNLPPEVELPEAIVVVPNSALQFGRISIDGPGQYDVSVDIHPVLMTESEARKALRSLVADFEKVGVKI